MLISGILLVQSIGECNLRLRNRQVFISSRREFCGGQKAPPCFFYVDIRIQSLFGRYIHVYINLPEQGDEVSIIIEDNGVGMAREGIEPTFDPFYQGEYENYTLMTWYFAASFILLVIS